MSNLPTEDATFNLEQILLTMHPLTQWLIRSGVGYNDFTAALKPLFYLQALDELDRIDQKSTVSAISLLSGLHRKDVSALKNTDITHSGIQPEALSVSSRVIGAWLADAWPQCLSMNKNHPQSFDALVKTVSLDVHSKSVLNELIRLGLVLVENDCVILQKNGYYPSQQQQEIRQLLSQNVYSHLMAGMHNLFNENQTSQLEEAIRAEELTSESVQILQQKAVDLWEQYSQELLELASKRCTLDKGKSEANQTFCLGIYQNDK
ncbi:DUF6502 family protein [Acinetobacter sp. ANC 3813]|uniref:DUF6502 family protein n=1 Tax=Acinetobacter sp. ANC 3813 TaxID=1977873 RepID=UPI000A32D99E|nr:DUF6502 family protein [Acinetobacter sp. ANC 3813]OTG89480.1 hypothetical protein B9T34_12350 [Acinetobacter sp. ANC 3813]